MKTIFVRGAVVSVGLFLGLFLPVSTDASCAGGVSLTEAIHSAPTAFVGTVTGVSDRGRRAQVHVDDVWKGVDLPADVAVVGSPDVSAAATDVDRMFTNDRQYLFVPTSGGPQSFQDNSCTQTQPYSDALVSMRPASAPGRPAPGRSSGRAVVVVGAIVAGALSAVGGALLFIGNRRRRIAAAMSAPAGTSR